MAHAKLCEVVVLFCCCFDDSHSQRGESRDKRAGVLQPQSLAEADIKEEEVIISCVMA